MGYRGYKKSKVRIKKVKGTTAFIKSTILFKIKSTTLFKIKSTTLTSVYPFHKKFGVKFREFHPSTFSITKNK